MIIKQRNSRGFAFVELLFNTEGEGGDLGAGDGGAGGAGSEALGGGGGTPAGIGEGWRSDFAVGLDDAYKSDWEQMSARITKPADMAKNYVEAQRMARSSVQMPGQNATDDEWTAFHSKIPGFPEAPDKYAFSDPEDLDLGDTDKEYRESFRPIAHNLGLTQRQLSGLEQFQYGARKAADDSFIAKAEKTTSDNTKLLKSVYGPDFEKAQTQFGAAVRHYAESDFDTIKTMQLADGTFAMDHPAFFNMFARIGSQLSEDPRDPANMQSQGLEAAQMEYDRIRQEAIDRGLTPSSHDWPTQKLQQLSERIHGRGSAVSGGSVSNL